MGKRHTAGCYALHENSGLFYIKDYDKLTSAVGTMKAISNISDYCNITGGFFYDGQFNGGQFNGGMFFGGEFNLGSFEGGRFYDGVFNGGEFCYGEFYDGLLSHPDTDQAYHELGGEYYA